MCGCIPAPRGGSVDRRTLEPGRHATQRGARARVTGTLGGLRSGFPLSPTQGALCCIWLAAAASPRAGTGCRFLGRFLRSRKLECQSCAEDFAGLLAPTVTNDSNLCIHFWSPMDRIDIIANSSLSGYGWNALRRTRGRKRVSQGRSSAAFVEASHSRGIKSSSSTCSQNERAFVKINDLSVQVFVRLSSAQDAMLPA